MDKGRSFFLNDEEQELYSRQLVLKEIGYNGQLKLKRAKACVIGVGGLGSSVVRQLAAMGVGYIRLVDRDVVELSNLQRQHLYDTEVIGYPKAEVAADRLSRLNPYITLEPLTMSINSENAEALVRGMDVVIDGLDAMKPRYAINRACVGLGVPYVFGAAVMTYGNASAIIPKETPCLECFYGNIDDSLIPTCAVVGVHPSILGIISSVEVSEAIRILLGEDPILKGRLLHASLEEFSMDLIDIAKREDCPVCGEKPVGEQLILERELVEEVCGRGGKRTFIVVPREDLKLHIPSLSEIFKAKGFLIEAKSRLGITSTSGKLKISLLQSGVMIAEGVEDKEELLRIYQHIITDELGIPWSRIE